MDEVPPGPHCAWCFRPADESGLLRANGLCGDCQREFADLLGQRLLRQSRGDVSPAGSFGVFRQLPPARLVETLRRAVAHHHEIGFGIEADAVWEACVGGYRAASRPYGASDAGFGRWLLEQEPGTFAAAGSARLVSRYITDEI